MGGGFVSVSLMETAPPADATAADPLPNAAALASALDRGLPDGRVVVDRDVLAAMSHDDAPEWAPVGRAVAGVRAETEGQVQHVVRVCAEFGAPIVPAARAPACPAAPTPPTAPLSSTCRG